MYAICFILPSYKILYFYNCIGIDIILISEYYMIIIIGPIKLWLHIMMCE